MATTYKTRYGLDWPVEANDVFIKLFVAKKWREILRDRGVEVKDPWEPLLEACTELFGDGFRRHRWAEEHAHDWVAERGVITWGCSSCGKAVPLDEVVYFPDGPGTMRDVAVGSSVVSATGRPAKVTAVYDQDGLPLYRVRFVDGSEVVCCGDHLWTVRYRGRTRWDRSAGGRRGVTGWREETVSTRRLASWTRGSLLRRQVSVPLTRPVEFTRRPVPLDPYVLGCLLGDGSLHGTVLIASHPDDSEVRDEVSRRLPPGLRLRKVAGDGFTYQVTCGRGGRRNGVVDALRSMGLMGAGSGEKFVPDEYMHNSLDVRLDLLAGLMDTDGCVDRTGRVSFSTVSPRLRDQVRRLLESVGAYVLVYEKHPSYTGPGGRRVRGRTAYEVYARGLGLDMLRRLFRLSRKRDRVREVPRHLGRRKIVSVEPVADRSAYPSGTRCITIAPVDDRGNPTRGLFPVGRGYVVTHNSNSTGCFCVLDWIVDPADTTILVGSTTKEALRKRTWESVERYFDLLQRSGRFTVPGKITETGYAILNRRDDDSLAGAKGAKAGIHGVALNDGGTLQGAHSRYVRLVVDELATIRNHEEIKTAIVNLSVCEDFKFAALANPAPWTDPSCEYALPEGGAKAVSVDTGSWRSQFGYLVRHQDGLKSPCIEDPSLERELPFLMRRSQVEQTLKLCHGNPDAPQFWQMVRGFPLASGFGGVPVLEEGDAARNSVGEPMPSDPSSVVCSSVGMDPAWTEGGDGACFARCVARRGPLGRLVLDFTNGLWYFRIDGSRLATVPAAQQMREQALRLLRAEPCMPRTWSAVAVDASANQGLAGELVTNAGAFGIMAVNSAERASDRQFRAHDPTPAEKMYYDRGTEAWCVLAEFCRAGQVRGLPADAVRALTTRRYATISEKSDELRNPLRLESKKLFRPRFGGSPDVADACALAALALKEAYGILPWGDLPRPVSDMSAPGMAQASMAPVQLPDDGYEDADPMDGPDGVDGQSPDLV